MTLDLSQDVLGLPTEFQPAIGDTPKQKKLNGRCAQIQTQRAEESGARTLPPVRQSALLAAEAAAAELVSDADDGRRVATSSAGLRNRCAETAQTHTNTAVENVRALR